MSNGAHGIIFHIAITSVIIIFTAKYNKHTITKIITAVKIEIL